jgi:hypothetical protein
MRFDAPCCRAVNPPSDIASFIARWAGSGAAERANYQLFLSELCDVIGVPRPDPTRPDDADNAYVFERSVTFHHPDGATSTGRIDLYKRGCYVLEAKQGVEKQAAAEALAEATKAKARAAKKGTARRGSAAWDEAMLKARSQAEQYARALPATEGRPPLLLVVDVGHSIEIYSEFSRTGGTYIPFPDPRNHRIFLSQLEDPAVRETLRLAWTDPLALDPSLRSARVTREIARSLGRLAASLEKSGHSAESVAAFLMRSLFTMFAEDVELLPKDSLSTLLNSLRGNTGHFAPMIEELWSRMKTGGFSTALRENIRHFNGGLFENATALPLSDDQFELLIEASRADWRDVEPSIFGTLLVRALDPTERHKLGAHYTPRAYVERLVLPTIIEPLRAEWNAVRAAALTLDRQGKTAEAIEEVQRFHRRLCSIHILDPACGTGNFLYVTLEHLKRLEGEVLDVLASLGHEQASLEMSGFTVDPHQFLGIEVNPRAAAIAEIVLWIGYLQWHFRTSGRVAPPEPIIRAFHNIECRDAVLACDATEPVLDEQGEPVTRWDGRTMKKHPVTGEDVPDETARVPALHYENPRPAEWPNSDFIVGNPPFIGNKRMRLALGDGYVKAVREAWPRVPETVDFVMYWASHATELVAKGKVSRLGFITTNSITQTFNRPVLQSALDAGTRIAFAVPDHPWVDSADGAQVRVAMSVFDRQSATGTLWASESETPESDGASDVTFTIAQGTIFSDLSTGVDTAKLVPLASNAGLACPGVQLSGQGFVVAVEDVGRFIDATKERLLRRYITGRDVTQEMREQYVLDTFGLTHDELRDRYPDAFQWLHDRVKPEREQNPREKYRREWWIHAEPRGKFRAALTGLRRFVVTSRTARHRTFQFLDTSFLPETKVLIFAFDDAFHLGVLSSRIHVLFANRVGGWLGVGNDSTYNHSDCLEKFPFPTATEVQQARIRDLAETLDAHRKRQQAQHPKLTLTDCYNVLEKLREGTALNAKEQLTHEQGLVTVLRQLHDDIEAAVADAYGLPPTAADEAILTHLCALNAQRAAEERAGQIRWLRPAFQNPASTARQTTLAPPDAAAAPKSTTPVPQSKIPWPKTLAEQAQSVRAALADLIAPASSETLASSFKSANSDRIAELLDTLASLGQARALPDGTFIAT